MHKKPHDEFIPNLSKRIRNKVWDDMTQDQKVDYIRIQFILAIRKIKTLPERATATENLVAMAKFIRKPIYNSRELTFNEKGHLNTITIKWATGKIPQTKWGAIRALESRIQKCDSILRKSYRDQKNEFLRTMGIRPVELEVGAEDLFKQLFEEEINEQQKSDQFKLV